MFKYRISLLTADNQAYPEHGKEPLYIQAENMPEALEGAEGLIKSKGITGTVKRAVVVREGLA